MPFVFIVLGLLFLVVAIRGTQAAMFGLLKDELWGSNSFVPWAAAILILGALGYARPVRPIADAMIGLIVLVMLLANKGGFFGQLNAALRNPTAPDATTQSPALAPPGAASAPVQPPGTAPGTPFQINPFDATQGGAIGGF
jgi:hypothetical protein